MRTQLLACILAVAALSGCKPSESTRTVTGQLTSRSYALDNPVVMAESSDSRVFVTHLSPSGHFSLQLPVNKAYRLTLANSTSDTSSFVALARINWPHDSGSGRWAVLGDGDALDLGNVARRGERSSSKGHGGYCAKDADGGCGGDDDSCHEDDGAKCDHGHEDDCDCDHKYGDGDHCDPDPQAGEHEGKCNKDHGYHGGDDGGGHHHGQCDGGSKSPAPDLGMSGGGAGSPCQTNADCKGGLTCIDMVCMTGTIS